MMFYLIAVSLSLGLIGLAAVTGKIKVVSPTPIPTQPHSPEEHGSLQPYHPHDEQKDPYILPSCSDDVCECGNHRYTNFGPDGPEY